MNIAEGNHFNKSYLKNKKAIFITSAILTVIILFGIFFYAVSFISDALKSTFDANIVQNQSSNRFEFEKLKKIGIIKD